MQKAVLYTRVSTDKDEQKSSLENQRQFYEEYCKRHNYELLDIYSDVGTGTNVRRRPDFVKMIVDAGLDHVKSDVGYDEFTLSNREPKFNFIIVKDVPRFSRSQHIGMLTLEYLRNKGVYVIFENVGLNTASDDWHLRATIMFAMAQNESYARGKSIAFTKKHQAKGGKYAPARLPYGYERNENKEFVINEEQAEVIRTIFKMYLNEGSHVITKHLNNQNILTQTGKRWSTDKILRIIKNRIYTGTAVVNRTTKKNITDTIRVDLPESEHIEIPDAVPPIITLKQWTDANAIIATRISKTSKRGRKPSVNDIYYGKIFCGNCSSRFVRHIGEKDKINYMCWNRRKNTNCTTRGIAINLINDFMNRINISSLLNNMSSHSYFEILNKHIKEETSNLTLRHQKIDEQILQLENENNNRMKMLEERYADGGSDTILKRIEKSIEDVQSEINNLIKQRDNVSIESLNRIKKSMDDKSELINKIRTTKKVTAKEKIELLDKIKVSEYEIEFFFAMPNFEEEVEMFNSIFKFNQIDTTLEYKPFSKSFRREHKAAREFWDEVDKNQLDATTYYSNNP